MSRKKGWHLDWRPQKKTMVLIENVQAILEENAAYLPMTLRQIFYQLVVRDQIPKTETGYNSMTDHLVSARRAKMIPFSSIRDDGFTGSLYVGWDSADDYINGLAARAEYLDLDLQNWQELRLIVWCEAGGMVPQLKRVASPYGIPVLSSGGFDSVTSKYNMAMAVSDQPHHIIHIGDFDPSGEHIASSLIADMRGFSDEPIGFTRLAVTEEQGRSYDLPTALPKKTDNRSFSGTKTIQAEALRPELLAKILKDGIVDLIDHDSFVIALLAQQEARRSVTKALEGIGLE